MACEFNLLKFSILFGIFLFVQGCIKSSGFQSSLSKINVPSQQQRSPEDDSAPEVPTPPSDSANDEESLKICSTLDFNGVVWPSHFQSQDKSALALALNISGSFEGRSGWSNLSNNFDQQGISLGLLNQNLGQGSLQPLLILLRERYPQIFSSYMTLEMEKSLYQMLDRWLSHEAKNKIKKEFLSDSDINKILQIPQGFENQDKYYYESSDFKLMSQQNEESVQWALNHIYSDKEGRVFKEQWRLAFKALASTPEYISIQIEKTQILHLKALSYLEFVGIYELRAYLFFFDVVVQNGSIQPIHFEKYFDWLETNPDLDSTEKLLKLMEVRIASSRPQWQEDVRRRKKAIILGEGVVHGSQRSLALEYCYNHSDSYRPTSSL